MSAKSSTGDSVAAGFPGFGIPGIRLKPGLELDCFGKVTARIRKFGRQ